jgi:transcription antitermination factor NusA-like protein
LWSEQIRSLIANALRPFRVLSIFALQRGGDA